MLKGRRCIFKAGIALLAGKTVKHAMVNELCSFFGAFVIRSDLVWRERAMLEPHAFMLQRMVYSNPVIASQVSGRQQVRVDSDGDQDMAAPEGLGHDPLDRDVLSDGDPGDDSFSDSSSSEEDPDGGFDQGVLWDSVTCVESPPPSRLLV